MGHILSNFAVLEAEGLLRRTILTDTSETSSSQSLMIQSVCVYDREPERSQVASKYLHILEDEGE